MDNNETTLETASEPTSFGVELGKAAALSAVSAAGTIVGFVVIGAVVNKVQAFRKNRAADKIVNTETE